MKKLTMFVLIIMILLTTTTSFASTYQVQYKDYALKLKEIGVFKGTSSGFELDREPTRVEAAVMFVRLLGAEKEALEKKYRHPFTDVPEWASDYVGYLYHEKLTNGTSETTFGSANNIQAKSYMTFILRALGYNDLEGDFDWITSLEFAKNKGIINEDDFNELNEKTFLRDHVAKTSYLALKMPLNHGETTLVQKLVDNNVISFEDANSLNLIEKQEKIEGTEEDTLGKSEEVDTKDFEKDGNIEYYIKGTISLPVGDVAPKGGITGYVFRSNSTGFANFYIPEGKSSTDYFLDTGGESDSAVIGITIKEGEGYFTKLYYSKHMTTRSEDNASLVPINSEKIDFTLLKPERTISGTIKIRNNEDFNLDRISVQAWDNITKENFFRQYDVSDGGTIEYILNVTRSSEIYICITTTHGEIIKKYEGALDTSNKNIEGIDFIIGE